MPKAIDNARISILTTARTLLAQEGYESLNMRTIAGASGIATGTVYNYFRAKDEIVFALMNEDWSRALESMDSALEEALASGPLPSARERARCLEIIFNPLKDFIHTYKGVWVILAAAPPEEKSPLVRHHDKAVFMEELAQKVKKIWSSASDKDYGFTLSFVCRSLAAYAQEGDCDFPRLAVILGSVMENLR